MNKEDKVRLKNLKQTLSKLDDKSKYLVAVYNTLVLRFLNNVANSITSNSLTSLKILNGLDRILEESGLSEFKKIYQKQYQDLILTTAGEFTESESKADRLVGIDKSTIDGLFNYTSRLS